MRSAGDDRVADPQPHSGDGSFDPGIETGYLRRATRDHPLDPDLGAAPFDPGSGTGYDDRRARRTAKRRRREEDERRKRELSEREEKEHPRRAALAARTQGGSAAAAAAAPAIEPGALPAELDPARSEIGSESAPAPVTELHSLRPQRPSLAERLERERSERARIERERRALVERERSERERVEREHRERRRREREDRLRRDHQRLRPATPEPARRASEGAEAPPVARRAVRSVPGRRGVRRRELIWPTAKAGFAVTVVLGVAAGLGSLLGLPVPGLEPSAGRSSLLSSASLFGVDPGTPTGLAGGFVYPVGGAGPHDYGEAAAKFGAPRFGHIHQGQDVFAKPGTPLFAVRDGVVLDGAGGKSFYAYGGGNSLVLYSPAEDRSYVYLHMLRPSPTHPGDRVHAGQQVGQVGCTGSCDGPHLHFEIRLGRFAYEHEGRPVDPLPYLRQWEQPGAG